MVWRSRGRANLRSRPTGQEERDRHERFDSFAPLLPQTADPLAGAHLPDRRHRVRHLGRHQHRRPRHDRGLVRCEPDAAARFGRPALEDREHRPLARRTPLRSRSMRHSSSETRLELDRRNGLIVGLCAGLARYFDVEATWLRIAAVIGAVLLTKVAIALYVIGWLLLDDRNG